MLSASGVTRSVLRIRSGTNMELVDGKTYTNGNGGNHTITGTPLYHPDWVQSNKGTLFERATGRFICMGHIAWEYELYPSDDKRSLKEEVL